MISVIVPVYNTASYLPKCIESILAQTYHNFELFLVDDGSTDESGLICDNYAKKDERIHVIHKKNEGVSSARNEALKHCSGNYISFLDSDDWIELTMFEDLRSAIIDSQADFAVCNETHIYETGGHYKKRHVNHWKEIKNNQLVDKDGIYRVIFARSGTLWNKLFKSSMISDIRFDENLRYGEDFFFLLLIIKNATSAIIIPKQYYNYNISRQGNVLSAKIDKRSIELLNNAKTSFYELSSRGYPEVGIRRVFSSICEVIQKIPKDELFSTNYKHYYTSCANLVMTPSKKEICTFLKSGQATTRGKCSFLLMRICFPLWVLFKSLT